MFKIPKSNQMKTTAPDPQPGSNLRWGTEDAALSLSSHFNASGVVTWGHRLERREQEETLKPTTEDLKFILLVHLGPGAERASRLTTAGEELYRPGLPSAPWWGRTASLSLSVCLSITSFLFLYFLLVPSITPSLWWSVVPGPRNSRWPSAVHEPRSL